MTSFNSHQELFETFVTTSEMISSKCTTTNYNNSTTTAATNNNTLKQKTNNENLCSAKLISNSKLNNGTPKRRLSYQNMNSPPITNNNQLPSKLPTPGILSSSAGDLSPVIKRKCMKAEKPIKSQVFSHKSSIVNATHSDSPFLISSSNLRNKRIGDESPKNLNDSFETMNNSTRFMPKRSVFSRHKSAPLSNLTKQFNNIQQMSSPISKLQYSNHQHPLNDISNHINQKLLTNSLTNSINNFKLSEDVPIEENDDYDELEDLINRNTGPVSSQNYIMESLERDLTCTNLIGDRSRVHILPSIVSNKHPDLCCISPTTLVDVLNGVYDDRVKEVIIIDSRYPYEYEGGHITHALNIFTKERLYDEMFIKRSHKNIILNNSTMDMDSSNEGVQSPPDLAASDQKRSIIIFHCEFSSERAPSLLKFLRNSDRTLNEHCYPNLFYPELYLLEGGYKSFYESFMNYCDPQTYKPMLHTAHQDDYKHFRSKSKSWEVSKQSIVYKYNEHLQRQKTLKNAVTECENEENDEPQQKIITNSTSHRVIKMKTSN